MWFLTDIEIIIGPYTVHMVTDDQLQMSQQVYLIFVAFFVCTINLHDITMRYAIFLALYVPESVWWPGRPVPTYSIPQLPSWIFWGREGRKGRRKDREWAERGERRGGVERGREGSEEKGMEGKGPQYCGQVYSFASNWLHIMLLNVRCL